MKKSKVKKIFSFICLLLVSCLVFSGCASVHSSVVINTDGSVEQGMQVVLDKNRITRAGYDYSDVANKVENTFLDYVNSLTRNILLFCDATDKNILTCGIETKYQRIDEQNFYGYIAFKSISLYRQYSDFISGGSSSGDDENNSDVEENLFFIKDINFSDTTFAGIDAKNAAGEYENKTVKEFTDYFNGSAENTEKFTLDDVEYNFYYGVPTNKLHSNCDHLYSQSGVEIHQWVFNSSNLNDQIKTWTVQIKPVAWYVLALILTFILVIILLIICLVKKKSKKIQNTIAQEEIS